ncbi:unnamed protein product [Allacma fusca]|uniref:Uncharacterized protein n=1 Tax=Allacma fusca TaxID=39272 RepID=A0A8J2KI10_9HEXA|nr:unnamed protein product [Allacma fusca]
MHNLAHFLVHTRTHFQHFQQTKFHHNSVGFDQSKNFRGNKDTRIMSFDSNIPTIQNQAQRNLINQSSPQFSNLQYQHNETDENIENTLNDIPASGATTFIPQPGPALAQPGPGNVQRSERDYQRHKARLIQCRKCGRSFFPHTITYHELNCKAGKLTTPPFNATKYLQQERSYKTQRLILPVMSNLIFN